MPWYGWVIMFCFYTACQTTTTVAVVLATRTRRQAITGQARTSGGRFASPVQNVGR